MDLAAEVDAWPALLVAMSQGTLQMPMVGDDDVLVPWTWSDDLGY